MEENASRAIMIGVGVFVIVLVLSGIILYVDAARKMATVVDKSLNSWDEITVSNIMDYTGDISIKCTGADFVNFLRKNFLREDIYITISSVITMKNLPISYWKGENTGNVSEVKLANINRSAEIVMKKSTTTDSNGVDKHVITIEGDVFANRDAYVTDSVWKMEKDNDGRYAYVTDGYTVIEIGDTVNYVTTESSGSVWKVLGAYDGKILLLGSAAKSITNDEWLTFAAGSNIFTTVREKFVDFDNGTGALKGSARCLNFQDIVRLTEVDHDTSYSDFGHIYCLSYIQGDSNAILADGERVNLPNGGAWMLTGQVLEWKQLSQLGNLNLEDDCYTAANKKADILNLTDKAKEMFGSSQSVFLNYISTRYTGNDFTYNARIMYNCNISDEYITDFAGTRNISAVSCTVRPVISLEQGAILEKTITGKWNVSI